jgi:hypothetical protein
MGTTQYLAESWLYNQIHDNAVAWIFFFIFITPSIYRLIETVHRRLKETRAIDIRGTEAESDWRNRPPPIPQPRELPEDRRARYHRLANDPDVDPVIRGVYADNLRAEEDYRRRSPFHPDA